MSRVGRLFANQQIGGFVSGLKENIRAEVQASRPSTLTVAVGLARLFEARSDPPISHPCHPQICQVVVLPW